MADYLYDGTFDGLLTCIHFHYYNEKAEGIYIKESYQVNMLRSSVEVKTDPEKADTVYKAIRDKISPYDLRRVYKVFMSSEPEKEMRILNYVRYGFKHGSSVNMLHGDPVVFAVQSIEKKVNTEIHRFKGLIRFFELEDGILYSQIEPDHDVVEFLAHHFTDRYKNEPFIIHDMRRSKELVAYKGEWYVTYFTKESVSGYSEAEKEYGRLWKRYFETIAIKERKNERCQKNLMPQRYWKNMTEFQI